MGDCRKARSKKHYKANGKEQYCRYCGKLRQKSHQLLCDKNPNREAKLMSAVDEGEK